MNKNESRQKFEEIVLKYKLNEPEKAQEIAKYIVEVCHNEVSAKEFAVLFNIELEDAHFFLDYAEKHAKEVEE